MDRIKINFLPSNSSALVSPGSSLLEAAREASVEIDSNCNGLGVCGKCLVKQVEGDNDHHHPDELRLLGESNLKQGIRLACRTTVTESASFEIIGTYEERNRILEEGVMPAYDPEPGIRKVFLNLSGPAGDDNLDDVCRVRNALGKKHFDKIPLLALRNLPGILRKNDFKATIIFSGDELIGIEPGDTTDSCFGIALDIGTTTIVASLFDLVNNRELAISSMINPQKAHGLDVLSRVQHTKEHEDGLSQLQSMVLKGINSLIADLCEKKGINKDTIYEVCVAANPAMMHLFLGINPSGIGRAPYVPVFTLGMSISSAELGIFISDFGQVYCLPSVSAYVGADIVAGILCTELSSKNEKTLFIDIGTNGEIVFKSDNGLYACSCAAGPALEGMNISDGMRAASGAIDSVSIDRDVSIRTIDNKPARGLCGSGVIDAVSELIKAGIITGSGRFKRFKDKDTSPLKRRLIDDDSRMTFILNEKPEDSPTVCLTQKDVRQVQLAKGAIHSGIIALLDHLGIAFNDIDRVCIAGAFGRCISMENFARLGVFPRQLLDRVVLVGNSSKGGAALCLLSQSKRKEAAAIARNTKYLELSCYPGYDKLFTQSLTFKEE